MNNKNSLNPEADGGVRAPLRREPERVFYAFAEITPWARNPRGAELRGIEEFAAQLIADGGIKEDLHVFVLNGVVTLMAGHRRHAAGQVAGLPGAWCKDYGPLEEGEAFELLLSLQQGNDPFDARELAKAAREGVALGIPVERLTGVMHRSAKTVQLYLDMGTLPGRVQDYIYDGRITLGTAAVLRQVAGAADQLTAATRIVTGPLGDGVSMGEGQSIAYIETTFLLPVEWRRKWLLLQVQLKKKYPVAEGYQYVEFEDRAVYVQGDVGMPERDYAKAGDYVPATLLAAGKAAVTWGDLAQSLEVGIFVVCAPNHKDGYVLVVMPQAIEDAESCVEEGKRVLKGRKRAVAPAAVEGRDAPLAVVGGGLRSLAIDGEGEEDADEGVGAPAGQPLPTTANHGQPLPTSPLIDEAAVLSLVGQVVEVLAAEPVKAMNDGAWRPLLPRAFEMVSRSGMLPPHVLLEIRGMAENHRVQSRGGLRWALTLLLACEAVRAEETGDDADLLLALKALKVSGE